MNKLCIITGGSRGIGAAIAMALANDDYRIAIIYNHSAVAAAALVGAEVAKGRDVRAYRADVADNIDFAAVLRRIDIEMGECSLLINNAGIADSGLLMDMPYTKWNAIMRCNLDSVYTAVHTIVPQMLRLGAGVIINIASVWGSRAASCEAAYAATKAGVISLTRSLAAELGRGNIRVNCISPGFIATDMTAGYSADDVQSIVDNIPLGRVGGANDVAELTRFLASDGASYITGQDIMIDGGWTL